MNTLRETRHRRSFVGSLVLPWAPPASGLRQWDGWLADWLVGGLLRPYVRPFVRSVFQHERFIFRSRT